MKPLFPYILALSAIAAFVLIVIIQPNTAQRHKKRLKDMRQWLLAAQGLYETTTPSTSFAEERANNTTEVYNPTSTQDDIIISPFLNDAAEIPSSTQGDPEEKPSRYDASDTQPTENTPLPAEMPPLTTPPSPPPSAPPIIIAIQKLIKKIEAIFELRVQGIRRAPVYQNITKQKFNNDILRLIKFFSTDHP